MAGCDRCRVAEARVKPPPRTMATKASIWLSSMVEADQHS